jgi:hypothetical protein
MFGLFPDGSFVLPMAVAFSATAAQVTDDLPGRACRLRDREDHIFLIDAFSRLIAAVPALHFGDPRLQEPGSERISTDPAGGRTVVPRGCSWKKRTNSREASGPAGSVNEPWWLPPDQA